MTRRFQIKIVFRSSSHGPADLAGYCIATQGNDKKIRLNFDLNNDFVANTPDSFFKSLKPIIRERAQDFIQSSKYPNVWNEENGIETDIKEIK